MTDLDITVVTTSAIQTKMIDLDQFCLIVTVAPSLSTGTTEATGPAPCKTDASSIVASSERERTVRRSTSGGLELEQSLRDETN